MKQKSLKQYIRFAASSLAIAFVFVCGQSTHVLAVKNTIVSPQGTPISQPSIVQDCAKNHAFLGLEPWYYFLPAQDFYTATQNGHEKCDLKCFNVLDQSGNLNECERSKSDLPLVLLAIIDDLLRIAGLVTLGFVIYGAFQFVGSQGNPEATAKARKTILNALLGMAVATIAIGVVSFIGNKFSS